jgi:DNA gyrase inhibitor GyrI
MKQKPRWLWISGAGLALVTVLGACKLTRAGYEEPAYRVVRKDGRFEVRDYEAFTVVSTPMRSGSNDMDGGFRRLFRYISGGNTETQKVAMTIPVFVAEATNAAAMSFVVPAKVAAAGAPSPAASDVTVAEVPPGRFAVLRFSGSRELENSRRVISNLTAWVAAQQLQPLGEPRLAYYDPPWTPSFLRRNEVMIRVNAE